jgi:hypothetical protein
MDLDEVVVEGEVDDGVKEADWLEKRRWLVRWARRHGRGALFVVVHCGRQW